MDIVGAAPEHSVPDPVLIACSHGTRLPAGRRTAAELRLAVGRLRPALEVWTAHVDVQRPSLADAVARLRATGRRGVVVPLLLSGGYHVHHDIAGAVATAAGLATAAAALGPDPALADLLAVRLGELDGGRPSTRPIVLAAAGSSDARAAADVQSVAADLQRTTGRPVVAGYLSAARPTVDEALVLAADAHGGAIADVAGYLIAPGFFEDRLRALTDAAGARLTRPLGAHDALARVALHRYDDAVRAWTEVPDRASA